MTSGGLSIRDSLNVEIIVPIFATGRLARAARILTMSHSTERRGGEARGLDSAIMLLAHS